MGWKIFLCSICLFFSFHAAALETQQNIPNEVKYAIALCLSISYPNTEFSSDASYIAAAYQQKGAYNPNVYEEIKSFVVNYSHNKYASATNHNLSIMQCVDLYDSNDLDLIINRALHSGSGEPDNKKSKSLLKRLLPF